MQTFLIVSLFWIVLFACYDKFQTKKINKLERKIVKYERMLYLRITNEKHNRFNIV